MSCSLKFHILVIASGKCEEALVGGPLAVDFSRTSWRMADVCSILFLHRLVNCSNTPTSVRVLTSLRQLYIGLLFSLFPALLFGLINTSRRGQWLFLIFSLQYRLVRVNIFIGTISVKFICEWVLEKGHVGSLCISVVNKLGLFRYI